MRQYVTITYVASPLLSQHWVLKNVKLWATDDVGKSSTLMNCLLNAHDASPGGSDVRSMTTPTTQLITSKCRISRTCVCVCVCVCVVRPGNYRLSHWLSIVRCRRRRRCRRLCNFLMCDVLHFVCILCILNKHFYSASMSTTAYLVNYWCISAKHDNSN